MDIIVLTIFGFLLLGFVSYWKYRHRDKVDVFLKSNQNVMPLFREKSAKIKFDILYDAVKNNETALTALKNLRKDFIESRISVENYEAELSSLQEQYIKH